MKIYEQVASDFDISAGSLRKRYSKWELFGDTVLIPKPKGRKEGDGKFLSDEQEA